MPIEKMYKINIVGPVELFDYVSKYCADSGVFHPENAFKGFNNLNDCVPFSSENPYSPALQKAEGFLEKIGAAPKMRRFDEVEDSASDIDIKLTELMDRYSSLNQRREALNKEMTESSQLLIHLKYLHNLSVSFDDLSGFRFTAIRFGRMSEDNYKKILQYNGSACFYCQEVYRELDYVWCMYFTPVNHVKKVDSLFAALNFVNIEIPEEVHGKPDEAVQSIENRIGACKKEIEDINAELKRIAAENKEQVLLYYSKLKYLDEVFSMRKHAARNEETFYLCGWVTAKNSDKMVNDLMAVDHVSCVKVKPKEVKITPPTKLKNIFLFKPFEQFVSMYGLPEYDEIDPTPIFSIIYTLIFGIMFGDVGQGAVIFLAGLFIALVKKSNFGRIMMILGVSSVAFGFIYGSVFGLEDLLPALIVPMDSVMVMLIGSIGLGVALILTAIILNIVNGFRQKDPEKALFSQNSIAGLVFYGAVVAGVALLFVYGNNIFTPIFAVAAIVIPVLLFILKEPLSNLIREKKFKTEEGWFSFALQSVFELIEIFLSFFSNTLSFMRIGAAALSHAGMMLAVLMLMEAAGSAGSLPVLILGNVFVLVLEGLLSGIQAMRLTFYEFFSRFYSGGGEEYSPVKIKSPEISSGKDEN